jgi:hypothetical protein
MIPQALEEIRVLQDDCADLAGEVRGARGRKGGREGGREGRREGERERGGGGESEGFIWSFP